MYRKLLNEINSTKIGKGNHSKPECHCQWDISNLKFFNFSYIWMKFIFYFVTIFFYLNNKVQFYIRGKKNEGKWKKFLNEKNKYEGLCSTLTFNSKSFVYVLFKVSILNMRKPIRFINENINSQTFYWIEFQWLVFKIEWQTNLNSGSRNLTFNYKKNHHFHQSFLYLFFSSSHIFHCNSCSITK